MARRTWLFETEIPPHQDLDIGDIQGASYGWGFSSPKLNGHTVELQHNYWTTKRTIRLDHRLLTGGDLSSYAVYGQGSDDIFFVDGHMCLIQIRPFGLRYKYELAVDGRSVIDGRPVVPWPETWQARSQTRLPWWGWLLTGLSPVVCALSYVALITALLQPSQLQDVWIAHLLPGLVVAPASVRAIYRIVRVSRNSTIARAKRVLVCCLELGLTAATLSLLCLGVILLWFRGA